jgi:hypothetical protein
MFIPPSSLFFRSAFPLVLLATTPACSGVVSGSGTNNVSAGSDAGGSANGGGASGAGRNGGAGSQGGEGGTGAVGSCEDTGLPPVRAWKLTRAQYLATVATFTGGNKIAVDIPADGLTGGFDTSDASEVTPLHAEAFSDYAEAAAVIAAAGVSTNFACVGTSTGSPDDACVTSFVTGVARKAYRRPSTKDEGVRYAAFFRKAEKEFGKDEAVKMTYEAALQSPWFLFRWETGQSTGAKVALTPYELASELSYLIADIPPSAALLAAADDGTLLKADVRERLARGLLAEPAARAKLGRFFSAYLHLDVLADPNRTKDPVAFPQFTPGLKQQMIDSTNTFVDKELWEAKGTLLSLFSASYAFVSPALAPVYGVNKPTAAGFTKIETDAKQRSGVLTQPAVIAALSSQKSTSPVHRGLFFARTLLCQEPPPPLAGAELKAKGTLVSDDLMATQRENWNYAKTNAAAKVCVSCHSSFHPMGLSLETYDAIGQYRPSEFGKPIDTSGELVDVDPQLDGKYADGPELARKIINSRLGQTCFVSQVNNYVFGRTLDAPDAPSCATTRTVDRFAKAKLSPLELLIALTQDETFTHRRGTN